jgi:putative hydrolase of the HAD superfamily
MRRAIRPRAILFDAVGTLIYAEPPVAEAYFRVGQELGSARTLAAIREQFRAAYRRSESLFALPGGDAVARQATSESRERERWRLVVAEVFEDLPEAARQVALDRLWRHFSQPQHWRLYDDVVQTWAELAQRGFVLGIASNFDQRLWGICRGLAPLDQCRRLFISSEIGYPKPAPEFFRAIEADLKLRGEEILLVGDDVTNDVIGASRYGWQVRHLVREGEAASGAIRSLRELCRED